MSTLNLRSMGVEDDDMTLAARDKLLAAASNATGGRALELSDVGGV